MAVPLDNVAETINQRGKEIESQVMQQNPGIPENELANIVKQQLAKEFGL
jgi:hypothetical protein